MPKKFVGENSKAVAARARKDAAKDTEKTKKVKDDEDAMWQDNDKNLMKKQQKKDEQERKRQEQLHKKAEAKALLEQEMDSIKKPTTKPPPQSKVTRAQIDAIKTTPPKKDEKKIVETHLDMPVEENINRVQVEGLEARSITEAISILTVSDESSDKHPEKRMKAAYTSYEERRLTELKQENPGLKHSQLKQMIFKEWQKSPENPLNKA